MPIIIQFDHCQSDNLSLLALVDTANLPAPGAAVRWQSRYAIGLPSQVVLYYRPAAELSSMSVPLDGSALTQMTVRSVMSNNVPVPIGPGGVQLPVGIAQIRFTRPVIAVELVALGSTLTLGGGTAYHVPFGVAQLASSAAGGRGVGHFAADLINSIELRVVQAGTLAGLQITLLDQANSTDWTQFLSLDWPAGQWPGNATWPSDQSAMLQSLYDATVKDASGRVLPMGERAFLDTGPAGRLSLSKLAALLFSAFAPQTARDLGLLASPSQPNAAGQPFDYAIVAMYPPRAPLAGGIALDFLAQLARQGPSLGKQFAYHTALLTSPVAMQLAPPAGRSVGGLALQRAPVWLRLSRPVQVVEFLPDPRFTVEATAFAAVEDSASQRIVDWMLVKDRPRATLCADRIDAVSFVGEPGAMLRAITFAETDTALLVGPCAAVGTISAISLNSRQHPVPPTPAPVSAVVLPDPVAAGAGANGELGQRNNQAVRIGVSFAGSPPPPSVTYDAVAYTLSRGPDPKVQTTVLASITSPLVLTDRAQLPASPLVPPATSPWSRPSTITPTATVNRIDYVDTVPTAAVAGTPSVVYVARALDLFGRLSPATASPAVSAASDLPIPAPIKVVAMPRAGGAYHITWGWPADPALGTEADIAGFRVYVAPAMPARGWQDGVLSAVSEAAAGEAPSPNSLPFFRVTADLDAALINSHALAGRSVRIGGDHYVICDAAPSDTAAAISARVYVNLSTPAKRPIAGDAIRLYDTGAGASALAGVALYDTSAHPPLAAANHARSLTTRTLVWPPTDATGVARMIVGVSAYDRSRESAICGPVPITLVDTSSIAPPRPSMQSEADAYTEPADAFRRCRYHYQALVAPGGLYHVYRALDAALLSARASAMQVRAPTGPLPSPITADDFTAAIAQTVTVPCDLHNRALHAIANLVGLEGAFERLTTDPIGVATGAQPVTLDYLDTTLPAGGANRYLYRLRAVSKSAEFGDWGWVSPPVWLRPEPPTRPTVQRVAAAGELVELAWTANPEPAVSSYRIYAALDDATARDERAMALAGEVSAEDAIDASGGPNLRATLVVPAGKRVWLCIVATAAHPAPVGTLSSAASDAYSIVTQTNMPPLPPAAPTVQRTPAQLSVTFAPDANPTSRYQLLRGTPGGRPLPVGPWVASAVTTSARNVRVIDPLPLGATPAGPPASPAITLTDEAPLNATTLVEYRIACTNESRRMSLSDAVAL